MVYLLPGTPVLKVEEAIMICSKGVSKSFLRSGGTVLLLCSLISTTSAQTCVRPPEGLVSWWPGDGNANDIQGSNNGTLQGGVTFGPGIVGQECGFDGVDGLVSFGKTIGNFGVANFTIDFWIKTTSMRQEGLLGKRPVCGDSSFWDIRLGSGPTSFNPDPGVIGIELDGDEAGTNFNPIRTKTTVNDGNFHHVAVVRSGATMSVYIDGRLDASRTTPGVTNIVNDAILAAGVSTCTGIDGTEFFTGQLDEIEIFDRALTASEIAPSSTQAALANARVCLSKPSPLRFP
jgi:Concanavalin A-like lectin/glucanases superfamily